MKVAVLGAGSWGTTNAARVSVNAHTVLWAREPEVVEAVRSVHENPVFLPGFQRLFMTESLRVYTKPTWSAAR